MCRNIYIHTYTYICIYIHTNIKVNKYVEMDVEKYLFEIINENIKKQKL